MHHSQETCTVCEKTISFYFLEITTHREQAGKKGTNTSSHLSLFHPFCPTFIFHSDSIDISIHLLPHSITSHRCMILPLHPSLQSHINPITPSIHCLTDFFVSFYMLYMKKYIFILILISRGGSWETAAMWEDRVHLQQPALRPDPTPVWLFQWLWRWWLGRARLQDL